MSDQPAPSSPSFPPVAIMLAGVMRLARFDASGAKIFENTVMAARRSFQLLIPFAVLQALFAFISGPALEKLRDQFDLGIVNMTGDNMVVIISTTILTSLVIWFGFLVLVQMLMRATGQEKQFPRLVNLHNWTMIVQEGIKIIPYLVLTFGIGGIDGFKISLMVFSLYSLGFQWFCYRQTSTMPGWATGLVLLRGLIEALSYLLAAQLIITFAAS
jgi:hypothetical protein